MLLLLDALYQLADEHLGLLAGLFDDPSAIFHMALDTDDPTALTRLEYTDPFQRLLTDDNTDGTLTSSDPNTDAELIFNTAGWTYIHFRPSHGWSPDKARPAVTRNTLGPFVPCPSRQLSTERPFSPGWRTRNRNRGSETTRHRSV